MTPAIDHLTNLTLERLAWLSRDAAKIRRWRAEDEAIGIQWNTREAGDSNKAPASNQ
jgi:hypothetical protein